MVHDRPARSAVWWVLLALLSFAFFACRPDAQELNEAALHDFAVRYAAAWSSQDPAAFARFYAEDGWLAINDAPPSIGRTAVEEKAREFMTAFPDMVVRLTEVRRVGERVEFHWHWTGTNTGPGGTGNAVDLMGYEEWVLGDDGLIRESRGHLDEARYQHQLNAEPPSP